MKEKWIAHNQNEMPKRLKPETLVTVRLEDGTTYLHPISAKYWRWSKGDGDLGRDIVVYKIVGEDK